MKKKNITISLVLSEISWGLFAFMYSFTVASVSLILLFLSVSSVSFTVTATSPTKVVGLVDLQ